MCVRSRKKLTATMITRVARASKNALSAGCGLQPEEGSGREAAEHSADARDALRAAHCRAANVRGVGMCADRVQKGLHTAEGRSRRHHQQ